MLPYVRSGTTEGDLPYLTEVFVKPSQLAEICGIEPGSLRIVVANKGAGKTALVEWLKKTAIEAKMPCILVRPDELADTGSPAATDLSTLKGFFYEKLLRTVAAEIGSQIRGYFPLVGDQAKLYEEARASNINRGDFITLTLQLISAVSAPAAGIDGVGLLKKLSGSIASPALTQAVNNHLLKKAEKLFLLLIDDTDQLATPDDKSQLNKIWALILAVRKLAMSCNSVRPIVTLRASVWARLMHENSGQRDQVDHIRPLIINLRSSDQMIIEIVERRMNIASSGDKVRARTPYGPYFEGVDVLLPRSKERRLWPDFISKSARERPRDALQLIKNMIESALSAGHEKIGDDDASKGMDVYSSERVDDVVNEYSLDLPSIREIIDSFHSSDFEMTFESVREHLSRSFGITSMVLRGKVLRGDQDEHVIQILALLHEIGFLNARLPDTTKPRGFDHKNYSDDPTFVRYTNWNNLQAASWEIHPAFRSHLINIKAAKDRRN
ncbi:MAG: hypothetical protein ABN502_07740 [Gammaproteobacteria bacterium]